MPTIIPTKKCNLRCKHCLRNDYDDAMLDINVFEQFIKDCNNYNDKCRSHCLTGGEPTMYEHLDDALKIIEMTNNKVSIITNGQENIDILVNNKKAISGVLISLDSGNKFLNDSIRGTGVYDKVLQSTELLKSNGIRVEYKICLHKNNYESVVEAYELAKKYSISKLSFSTVMPVKNREKHHLDIDKEYMLKAYRLTKKYSNQYKIRSSMIVRHFTSYVMPDWLFCNPIKGVLNGLVLLPNADISFCCDLVDNDYLNDRNKNKHQNPLSTILGNYVNDGFGVIVKNKQNRINVLKHRRVMDFGNDKLIGDRQFLCDNCKYYHSL